MSSAASPPGNGDTPAIDLDEQERTSLQGLGVLIEEITPWLLEVGSWIFGGLSAFSLVVLASLITVGPVDEAVMVSITALASALPLNVAGILLLRLIHDTKDLGLDDLAFQAFQHAGFPHIEAYFPPAEERALMHRRRARVALRYSLWILALSIVLTFTGILAALWHMAWWTSAVLLGWILVSALLVLAVVARSQPPESEAERALKRVARAQRRHQARVPR